jgi:hypothetical protein
MPEESFWRTTPRKLHALLDAHIRANDPEQAEKMKPNKGSNKESIKSFMNW